MHSYQAEYLVNEPKPASQSIPTGEDAVDDINLSTAALTLHSDITPHAADVENVSANGSQAETPTNSTKSKKRKPRKPRKYILKEDYIDIIKDAFWESRPWILA